MIAALIAAVVVGQFSAEGPVPPPWQVALVSKKVPPTRYRVTRIDGVMAIEGSAEASMALLARPITVDLNATPILCWRWAWRRCCCTAPGASAATVWSS